MAAVATPFAYYTTLVSSTIFGLTAIPQLIKPVRERLLKLTAVINLVHPHF